MLEQGVYLAADEPMSQTPLKALRSIEKKATLGIQTFRRQLAHAVTPMQLLLDL